MFLVLIFHIQIALITRYSLSVIQNLHIFQQKYDPKLETSIPFVQHFLMGETKIIIFLTSLPIFVESDLHFARMKTRDISLLFLFERFILFSTFFPPSIRNIYIVNLTRIRNYYHSGSHFTHFTHPSANSFKKRTT